MINMYMYMYMHIIAEWEVRQIIMLQLTSQCLNCIVHVHVCMYGCMHMYMYVHVCTCICMY